MADNYSVIYGWNQKFYTPAGSEECPEFGYVKETVPEYDDSGKKVGSHEEIVFKKTGSYNLTEYINSFEDTTDLKKIFERYQMGDVSVLAKRIGDYADTVGCPETLLDAQLMLKNGEKAFAELPSYIKEQYDNDPMKFIQACQDGSITDVINGLDTTLKTSVDVGHDTFNELQASNKKIEELQAQIEQLKGGIKYE